MAGRGHTRQVPDEMRAEIGRLISGRRRVRAGVLAIVLLGLAISGCSRLFFYPSRVMEPNLAAAVLAPRDVYFRTSDGLMLHGLFFEAEQPQGTILALHGNAENLSTHVNSVLWLVLKQFNLFTFDYRGYGLSEGRPTLEGVHRDAEAALSALQSLPAVSPDSVFVLGQSLGGAIAVHLVASAPHAQHIRGLIIDSSFASYRMIAREKMAQLCFTWPVQAPASLLFDDSYSPVDRIGTVSPVPVLILHDLFDPVVPFHHAELLFSAARPPKELLITAGAGHIHSLKEEAVREQIMVFLLRAVHHPANGAAAARSAAAEPAVSAGERRGRTVSKGVDRG